MMKGEIQKSRSEISQKYQVKCRGCSIKPGVNFMGYGRLAAYELFALLKGTTDVDETSMLRLDFMEMKRSPPCKY
jgi:hypothetical protein